jgi:hypothetical protein
MPFLPSFPLPEHIMLMIFEKSRRLALLDHLSDRRYWDVHRWLQDDIERGVHDDILHIDGDASEDASEDDFF